jgi:endo-1,3(4)-beta-glucanase
MESTALISQHPRRSYTYLPVVDGGEQKALNYVPVERADANRKSDHLRTAGVWMLLCSMVGLVFFVLPQAFVSSPAMLSAADTVDPTLQSPFKPIVHPEPPSTLWGTVSKPYPTGAFWTNFAVGTGESAVGAYPYGIKALSAGIQISYGAGRRAVTKKAVTDYYAPDLQISAVQPNAAHSVEKYDKLSVKVGYKTVAGGLYHIHVVKSSPFVTVQYENAAPVISSDLMHFLSVEPQSIPGSAGAQYIVTLGNYQKWLVYCSEPTGFAISGNTMSSPTPIKGYIRVAVLPLQNPMAAFTTLMQYVRRYPIGATVSLQYPNDRTAVERIDYTTAGDGPLLMYALPHHAQLMTTPYQNSDENVRVQTALNPIYCIKGKLLPVVGTTWLLQYNLTQVGWNYGISDKLSISRLDEVGMSLTADVHTLPPTAQDPYAFGKQIQRMASLALLADTLGIAEARKSALFVIEDAFTPWLLATNVNALVYDTTYGGVLTTNGIADRNDDFGSGWYNDHHFHYGYLIYAAAVIAKLDAPYFADPVKKAAVESLVQDICNMDEKDPKFPYARHKDFFDGHSWASGIMQQGNGKGQESSSEVRRDLMWHCVTITRLTSTFTHPYRR